MKTTFSRRELYALGEPLGDSATVNKLGGGRIFGMGGGGGSPPPTQQTVTQTNIPEYARPYVETMLGATQQQLFNTQQGADGTTQITGVKPYQAFGTGSGTAAGTYNPTTGQYDFSSNTGGVGGGFWGNVLNQAAEYPTGMGPQEMRAAQAAIAGFSPLQQQAQQGIAGMQLPGTYGQAAGATGDITQRAMNYGAGYQPAGITALMANAPQLQQYQMGPAQQVSGMDLNAPQMATAQTGYAPQIQAYQMGPAERVAAQQVGTPLMDAAQTAYAPSLQTYQMGPAQQVRTQSFLRPGTSEAYMSPYMQDVVEQQQREAIRQSGIAGTQLAGQATQAGAFGGSRYGLQEAERQRNLATQLGGIQAQGLQSAFQQAQQQFNTEQQARLAAQQANQQAGLTVGGQNLAAALGVQQLGTQTGAQMALANLNAQQQANVQNQAAQLQAQGMNAQQALQAALANQQAGLTVGQQNLAAQQAAQQLGTQTGLQTALANLSAEQQANVQNQAAQLQTQGLTAQQAMQAALANQQAGLTVGGQNLAAQLGIQQLGAGQNLQAQLANQQALQAAQQLQAQQQQFGANLGLQGLQTGLQGAGQLANIGGQALQAQQGIYGLQAQTGATQQQQQQNLINQMIQNYATTQQYPQQQLAFMNAMLRGLPLQTATTQSYQAAPSMASQLTGLGLAGAGAYGLATGERRKKGGKIKEKAGMGIDELAMRRALEGA